jgi:carbamoyl-phosphate synthase large subunit
MWFLKQYEGLYRKEISNYKVITTKRINAGSQKFADRQIAHMMGCLEKSIAYAENRYEYQPCVLNW